MIFNIQQIVIEEFVKELDKAYVETYGSVKPEYANILVWVGRMALEIIAGSDILYHNVQHTIMVTMAGQAILKGKHLKEGRVSPSDWMHFIIALLCHDVGYKRGVCKDDNGNVIATGMDGMTVILPDGCTDASTTPYHVDRSKLFVMERFFDAMLSEIDPRRIVDIIELTKFPVPDADFYKDTSGYPGLCRAADFIGQLGDPDYLKNIPALFYEFEEIGINEKTGYKTPGDMRASFSKFYWHVVNPFLHNAFEYLKVTQEGNQWIANLHAHVFRVEHDMG